MKKEGAVQKKNKPRKYSRNTEQFSSK